MTAGAASITLDQAGELLDRNAQAKIRAMIGRELHVPHPEAVAGSRLAMLIGPAAAERLALAFPGATLKVPEVGPWR